MAIEKFTPPEAFRISNFLIFICSLCTFYMGVKDKYANPSNSFVDYDIAVIFCPTMLLGTKFGTILNKTFSNLLLSLILITTMIFSIKSTHKNWRKQQEKENSEVPLDVTTEASEPKYTLMTDNMVLYLMRFI
jgi:uncharacterized membrane protein YfcA